MYQISAFLLRSLLTGVYFLTVFLIASSCNKDKYHDPQPAGPEPEWQQLTAMQSGVPVNSMAFTDSLHGICVGDSGMLAVTTDGGKHWNIQYPWPGKQLFCVRFSNPLTAWICGSQGLLLKSDDGGANWSTVNLNTATSLRSMFWEGQRAWIVGNPESDTLSLIYYSGDGGQNWIRRESATGQVLLGVYFRDSLGWACGLNGQIIRTSDYGNTWLNCNSSTTAHLRKVFFNGSSQGYAVGENGTWLKSGDGGAEWTGAGTLTYSDINDICFTGLQDGWMAGENGKIFRTRDGGISWTSENSHVNATLLEIHMLGASRGYAAGYTKSGTGIVLAYK
ncbi:MAG TPA: YCF48-related protein [Bacteroidales bacterium]|nr:YCF48-related protein [Bacteroidales bacterium]HSA44536.1 YCF48-related protein [Bacteroidales bacterium]